MIHESLQSFFNTTAKSDNRGYSEYFLVEGKKAGESKGQTESDRSLSIKYNEENEVKIVLYSGKKPIASVQSIQISKVTFIKDEEEESIQFVLARMPSRMIKVSIKPFLSIELDMYWEVCEDCE